MKKPLFLLLFSLLVIHNVSAQCYCEDCPELIIYGSPSTATLNISGATNNILGSGGQSLVNVGVQFTHDAAQELSLRIVAPNGSFVDLTIGEGLDFGVNNNFDIDFIQCAAGASPDCTNDPLWSSLDEWDEGPYSGSYYPEVGCLEDLTGDMNGTWTLEMEDVFVIEDGELYCFDLTFADDSGISCNNFSCDEVLCLAQGGNTTSPALVTAPEGDPSLIIDYTVSYNDCEFPPSGPEYIFVYVIHQPFPGTIVDIVQGTVDLTTYPGGIYLVQGLSILASDLPIIEALDYSTTTYFDLSLMFQNGTICADNTTTSSQVVIDGCIIDVVGTLESDIINAEVGAPALDPNWMITWIPSDPDFGIWGIYYVVYDQVTGVIIDYLSTDDFTGLPAGDYFVSVLFYKLSDETEIPPANGVTTFTDLELAILVEDVCGLTFGQNELNISEPCIIDFDGMLEVDLIMAPENDPALDPDWDITFTGTPPDPAVFDFFYVVYEVGTDILIALYTTDDFTFLLEGNYYVSIVYYDIDNLPLVLTPNGINTFTDLTDLIDNGAICGHYFGENELIITAPCEADAGTFSTTVISECEGSSNLMLDLTPQYSGGGPDLAEYGYTYVISQGGIITAIDIAQDFTGYTAGVYKICGLSYLLTDVSLLPFPNGVITTANIESDIANEIYCADLMTVCLTLTISEVPVPIFTGPDEVCAGESVQYVVQNFSGNNLDYLYTVQQGSFDMFFDNEMGTIDITWLSGPGNICVTEFDNGCEGETCIIVNVLPQPDFTIDGSDLVCPGVEEIYTFDPAPSGLEFYDISINGGTISSQTTSSVTIIWDDVVNGSISAFLLGGNCDSEEVVFDVVVLADVAFPDVMIPNNSCINSELMIDDIDVPEILSWDWTATNADIVIDNGIVTFAWQSIGMAEICLEISTFCNTVEMCYDIDIEQGPIATNLTTICDGDSYVVEFEITGGTSPYSVNGTALGSTTFTSMPVPSGDVYGFTILDSEGCSSDLIQGTEVCNCLTNAGTMSQVEISICAIEGTEINGSYLGGATLDGNDSGQFVLHTNASNVLGTILALNNNPIFTYENAFGVNVTLYISHIAGDDDNGNVDLNDDCLSVSLGQPVVISELIKVDAGSYDNQCALNFDLNANDQGEEGIWIVVNSPLDANIIFGDIMNPQSSFETDSPGMYRISWSPTDALCVLPDTTTFVLEPPLEIENITADCSDDLETYVVSLEVTGGVQPYYLDGTEVTNTFDLAPVESGKPYGHVLTDSRGCHLLIGGLFNCECMNMAGSMSMDTLKGCTTDSLTGFYNEDAVLDMNDRELFVLHTSSTDTLGAVFYISYDPQIFFQPGMIPGNVYYLSHIIGDADGPGIDYSDPCIQISIGQPVIFDLPPEVNAGVNQAICGMTAIMDGSSSEMEAIWSVIMMPAGATFSLDESDPNGELTVSLPGQYVFELIADNGYCSRIDTVFLTFSEALNYQDLSINCMSDGYTVSFTISGGFAPYAVDGNILAGNIFESEQIPLGEPYSFTISDLVFCPPIDVDGTDTCDCENDAGTMVNDPVVLCIDEFVDVNTLNNNDFILDNDDIRYHVFHTSASDELGDVLGYFLYLGGIQELSFTDFPFEEGVTYYISTVLANMGTLDGGVDDPCLMVAPGTPIVWNGYNEVSIGSDVEACIGDVLMIEITSSGTFPFEIELSDGMGLNVVLLIDQENYIYEYEVTGESMLSLMPSTNSRCLDIENAEMMITIEELPVAEVRETISICSSTMMGSIIELDELIISGYEGGMWLFGGNEISGILDFDGFAVGMYQLEYVIASTLCSTSNLYTVLITVDDCDCPVFDYTSQDISCFGESDGLISILVEGDVELANYTILLNDVEQATNEELTDLSSGSYTLDITDGENCLASFEIDILEPAPVQISLGEDMEAEINDPVVIEAITNLIAQEIDGITWSSLAGILDDNDLMLNTSFQKDDMISINIIDENGCEASDEIMVRVTFGDYILPNVINTNSSSGNNVFRIYNSEGIDEVVSFKVFDRWGNEMFGLKNVAPDLVIWDGAFGGKVVNSGVYVFRIEMVVSGELVIVFGDLMVM